MTWSCSMETIWYLLQLRNAISDVAYDLEVFILIKPRLVAPLQPCWRAVFDTHLVLSNCARTSAATLCPSDFEHVAVCDLQLYVVDIYLWCVGIKLCKFVRAIVIPSKYSWNHVSLRVALSELRVMDRPTEFHLMCSSTSILFNVILPKSHSPHNWIFSVSDSLHFNEGKGDLINRNLKQFGLHLEFIHMRCLYMRSSCDRHSKKSNNMLFFCSTAGTSFHCRTRSTL